MRHVDWSIVKCLVIAGPGFTKEDFRVFLDAEAVRRDERSLILNKSKIILAPASSAFKHSLKEVLALPSVASQIKVMMGCCAVVLFFAGGVLFFVVLGCFVVVGRLLYIMHTQQHMQHIHPVNVQHYDVHLPLPYIIIYILSTYTPLSTSQIHISTYTPLSTSPIPLYVYGMHRTPRLPRKHQHCRHFTP